MVIKILGSGCASCARLEEAVRDAVSKLDIDADVVKVTDFSDIVDFGVMATPALVVDEQVKVAGRVPKAEEIESILTGSSQPDA